jgi:hypothetical protein
MFAVISCTTGLYFSIKDVPTSLTEPKPSKEGSGISRAKDVVANNAANANEYFIKRVSLFTMIVCYFFVAGFWMLFL